MNFIENVSTIIDNEKKFNILCHHMAKSNFSLASNYVEDIFTKSVSNKDKFINLTKACFLALRIPLLYLPLANRVTQIFLHLLSPKLTKEFVDSPGFFKTIEERKLRYSPYAREGFEKKQIVKYNFLHNEEKKSCLKSFLTYTQTISLVKTLKQ
ncbi:MAG TPA: hypothetical protein VGZ69_07560, partial [Candidatus Rhabdochlamydia sp.]|nr:hypothetical protein [Candidatus Rhabdochlamydia sp.]